MIQHPPGWTARWGIALSVGIVTFVFRFLIPDFENDHFMHLSWARQMALGEVPVWDFVEPGFILQTTLSALFQAIGGHELLGEMVLTAGLIALAAALVYIVALDISGSIGAALLTTFCLVALFPRLYNYPKILLYPLALLVLWRYVDGPSTRRLWTLSVVTAVAFLFRHDHGVYIACIAVPAMGLLHWQRGRATAINAVRSYALQVSLLLLPYGLFVVASGQVVSYVRFLTTTSTSIANNSIDSLPRFVFDTEAPWWRIAETPGYPVHVRWPDGLDPVERRRLERRYALGHAERLEGTTWRYELLDDSSENIAAMVGDPLVEDTQGVDRSRYEITADLVDRAVVAVARVPPLRFRPLPGFFDARNATSWLAWIFLALPAVGAVGAWNAARRVGFTPATTKLVTLVGMAALLTLTMIRGSYDSRLADAAAPMAVLGAWAVTRGLWPFWGSGSTPTRRLATVCRAGGTLMLIGVTVWAIGVYGRLPDRLKQSSFSSPSDLGARLAAVTNTLAASPLDTWAPASSEGLRAAVRYVHQCTSPNARLQVLGFEPQAYYYAERGFAAGQSFFHSRWHDHDDDQRRAIAKWATEPVPIVLAVGNGLSIARNIYPRVYDYIMGRYSIAASPQPGDRTPITVLVDRNLTPVGSHPQSGFPCFVAPTG